MDIGSMNVLGLGSGMDLQGIIDKLVNVDKKPILMKQSKKIELESYYQTFNTLESYTNALMADSSTMLTNLNAQTATTSDDSIGEAEVTGSPASGVHNVDVTALAKGESWISNESNSSSTNNIVSVSSGAFKYKVGTKEYSVELDNNSISSTPTTLNEFINAINNNGSGVKASLVYDGSGYKAVLKTPDGTNNNLTIEQNDTKLTFGTDDTTPNEASSDASLTIDGVSVTSHSNTLSDNIAGLKITLKDLGSFSIHVDTDYQSLSDSMQNIVDDYNKVAKEISDNSGYDAQKNVAGAFFGNYTAQSISSSLKNIFLAQYGDSSSIASLNDLGLSFDESGKLTFDSATFNSALESNFSDVKKMLDETTSGANDGFLNVLHDKLYSLSNTNGDIEVEKTTMQNRMDNIQEQIDRMNKQLDQERTMLTMTFAQMDEYMGALKNQSSYMQQVFDSMNGKSNK